MADALGRFGEHGGGDVRSESRGTRPCHQNAASVHPIDTPSKNHRSEGSREERSEQQQQQSHAEHAQFGKSHRQGGSRTEGSARPGVFHLRGVGGGDCQPRPDGHRGRRQRRWELRRRIVRSSLGMAGGVPTGRGIHEMHDRTDTHDRNREHARGSANARRAQIDGEPGSNLRGHEVLSRRLGSPRTGQHPLRRSGVHDEDG
mmetsp:Transcript_33973/g.62549  ORF Transcript_33973/g.62549 Transcript_33973/m.62549 type:complete len:202 (+) Transcript_33973:577-1182(+)